MADKEKLIECVIVRDTWDGDGVRHKAGKVVSLPAEAAIDGIESGTLIRKKSVK